METITYAVLIIAILLTMCAWLYRIAVDSERRCVTLRRAHADAIDALAASCAKLDARDSEIARLRQVRREYVEHLITGCTARSVAELRREVGEN